MQQITLDRTAKSTENWQEFVKLIKVQPVQHPKPNTVVSRIVKLVIR